MEGIRRGLARPDIARQCRERLGELPALAAELEGPAVLLMLDQENRRASGPRLGADHIDRLDDPVDFEGGVFADTERALDVDDQECGGHGSLP
ncbi:hypothetical protein D3C81_1946180 [compost metagenome]